MLISIIDYLTLEIFCERNNRACVSQYFICFFFSLDLAMLYSRVKIYLLMDTVFWHLTGIMMKRVFFFTLCLHNQHLILDSELMITICFPIISN